MISNSLTIEASLKSHSSHLTKVLWTNKKVYYPFFVKKKKKTSSNCNIKGLLLVYNHKPALEETLPRFQCFLTLDTFDVLASSGGGEKKKTLFEVTRICHLAHRLLLYKRPDRRLHSPACWGSATEQVGPGVPRGRHLMTAGRKRASETRRNERQKAESACCALFPLAGPHSPGLNLMSALPLVVVPSGNISIWDVREDEDALRHQ